MPLTPGHKLAAYEIIGSLGTGGMGEVYRARDSKLGREVALKILPPEVTKEAGRLERFDREARAIAALNHPHIVTIFSTEESDGIRFLTMELVEGCTLSDLVISNGMAVPRFLDIAIPLADALAAAHQKQITHRDLKPGNVMVSNDGRVKVLDFGLARVGGAEVVEQTLIETLAPITQQGAIVGTMPYMSPEQVEGRPIDARSDLFSLGVIFYELLSGQRPFKGGSSPALMSAILRDSPPPIGESRNDVPDALERLISRLIEKRPEDRVQTARDVFNELKHVRKLLDSGAARPSTASGTALPPQNLWIAVLPLGVRGADQDSMDLSAGLTEDITTGLGRFPVFNVVAAQSTRAYKDSSLDIRQIGDRLGARYVIGGQIRKSARIIRVTAQLTDAASGAQLWSETYDRDASTTDLFTIQDDVTDHIVATIGDQSGVLARSMVKSVRTQLAAAEQTSRELLLRTWGLQHDPIPAEHAELRDAIEARLEIEPDNADLWAELAHLYLDEQIFVMNKRPDPLGRANRAARRAVGIDPNNQQGWSELAAACFFARDRAGFFEGAERAIAINPRNSHALGWIGNLYTHAGEYERGSALSERAMAINPRHPGWLHFANFNKHFAAGDYEAALRAAQRVNMPRLNWTHFCTAAAASRLGLIDEAHLAAERMREITPALAEPQALREMTELWHWQPEQVDGLIDAVLKARTAEHSDERSTARSDERSTLRSGVGSKLPSSTAGGMNARLSVSVRPFVARSADDDSKALADALTDDIRSGLSRFGNLRVLAASAQGARYVIEGQVRRSGGMIRVSSSLTDTQSGEHLWTEQIDRDVAAGIFSLQDDVAGRIVAAIGDPTGVLTRSIAAATADRPYEQLTVLELVARYHAYTERFRPDEHLRLRDAFEQALQREPLSAEAWAALSMLYWQEHTSKYNPLPDAPGRQRRAAERSVEIDPHNQQGWLAMASSHRYSRDQAAVRAAVDRAIRVNPLNPDGLAHGGLHLAGAGDYDRALELTARAVSLKPHHPGWFHLATFCAYFAKGEYAKALLETKQISNSQIAAVQIGAAAAAGFLDQPADIRPAVDAIKTNHPALLDPRAARDAWAMRLLDESLLDRIEEGFRRALQVVGSAELPSTSGPAVDRPPSSTSGVKGAQIDLSVVVLPFASRGGDEETHALADGLTDQITTGLSRFGYLQVLSRSTAEQLSSTRAELQSRARYAIEGNVRRDGAKARVAVTLVNTLTGRNLWTSTYDRELGAGTFAIQDEVSSVVVATIGDQTGVLMRAMVTATLDRPLEQLVVAELVVRYHLYAESFDPAEHARLRDAFERALEREPRAAEGWACLSFLYEHEHSFGFNPRPDSRQRERQAAERAHELDPNSQQAWIAIAGACCFRRDRNGLKNAVERAISINPLNAELLALGAIFLSVASERDRAVTLVRQAMALKPQHAGWYYYPLASAATERGEYEEALGYNKMINMPRMPLQHVNAAACAGHLGLAVEARLALQALRSIDPQLAEPDGARAVWAGWIWSDEWIASLVEGFAKARALEARSTPPDAAREQSIAVLPFTDLSEKKDQDWFCDGIAEEIMSALAPLAGLRVAARASAFSFRGKSDDLTVIADKLQVGTVLEGSVRRAGDRVRITTQLSDAKQGKVLWSERFDRELKDIFDVQEEIARAIADRLRITIAEGSSRLVQQGTTNMEAYALLLQGRAFVTRRGRAILEAIPLFERAIALDPNLAEAHALLGDAYRLLGLYGIARASEVMPNARASVERALAIDPNQVEALATHAIIASVYEWNLDEVIRRSDRALAVDSGHVRTLAERAISVASFYHHGTDWHQDVLAGAAKARALDPLNAWAVAIEGFVQMTVGLRDASIANTKHAIELDPNNFTGHWIHCAALATAGRDDEALAAAVPALAMSGRHPNILSLMAAIHSRRGHIDQVETIRVELEERSTSGFIGTAIRATVAASAGRWPEARALLARAIEEHDPQVAFWKMPAWQAVWKDDHCDAMLRATSMFKRAGA
jgi:TolB-like protein/Flp pilus assembly protein TadD